jgi:hypothetical protein
MELDLTQAKSICFRKQTSHVAPERAGHAITGHVVSRSCLTMITAFPEWLL